MPVTSYRLLVADNIGQLNQQIAAAAENDFEYALSPPAVLGYRYVMAVGQGGPITYDTYEIDLSTTYKDLVAQAAARIDDGLEPYGGPIALTPTQFAQVYASGLVVETGEGGAGGAVAAADITDSTDTGVALLTAADPAAGRTALGLGALATLNAVGTGQITDGTITNADINAAAGIGLAKLANVAAGTNGLAAGTVQATFQALATRIAALEAAP